MVTTKEYDLAGSFHRQGAYPIDKDSVFTSLSAAQNAITNHPGQIIAILPSSGVDVALYKVQNDKTLSRFDQITISNLVIDPIDGLSSTAIQDVVNELNNKINSNYTTLDTKIDSNHQSIENDITTNYNTLDGKIGTIGGQYASLIGQLALKLDRQTYLDFIANTYTPASTTSIENDAKLTQSIATEIANRLASFTSLQAQIIALTSDVKDLKDIEQPYFLGFFNITDELITYAKSDNSLHTEGYGFVGTDVSKLSMYYYDGNIATQIGANTYDFTNFSDIYTLFEEVKNRYIVLSDSEYQEQASVGLAPNTFYYVYEDEEETTDNETTDDNTEA